MAKDEKTFVVKFNEEELNVVKIALNNIFEILTKQKADMTEIDYLLEQTTNLKEGLEQVEEEQPDQKPKLGKLKNDT